MTSQTTTRCTICGPEAIDAPFTDCPDDTAHRAFVERLIRDEDRSIHVDECPDCGTPTTWHPLDPPGHCPHGWEHRVPVEYVPAERLLGTVDALREAVEAARLFNRGGMSWREYDAKLARWEQIATTGGQ